MKNNFSSAVDLTVIAPCYNEALNIAELVRRTIAIFDKMNVIGELILVDDASQDETASQIQKAMAVETRVRIVRHAVNRGLFQGWRSGLEVARGHFVCLIDADLQTPPEEIARLYRVATNDAVDMVQGVRSSIARFRDNRYFFSRGLNVLLNLLFGMSAADNKSGFIICPRDILTDVLDYRNHYAYPHTFIRVAAERKGYNVKEVETLFVDRKAGKSFISPFPINTIMFVLLDLIKAVFDFCLSGPETDIGRFLRNHKPLREPESYTGWRRLMLETYFLTMPLHKWMIGRPVRKLFFDLRRSQYLSRADIDAYRLDKLKRLVRHAYNHVSYYRQTMQEAGVKPEDIVALDDIVKLPMLSKSDVRENLHFDLFADNHKKKEMLRISTSGSTGEPFIIYADKHQLEVRMATTMRAAEWTGWRFGDSQVRLWHQTIGMSPVQVIRERIDAWFMRRLFIPAYEMRDDNIRDLVQKIRHHKPVLIDGYAESFNFLAHYIKDKDIDGFQTKAIMSSAQIMPNQVRKIIEERLGAPVFDKYGSREFSGIAYEDEGHDGHIVMAESYIVEIILKNGRPALPGEVGEVVITDLNNMHVPIIRYRIGDLAQAIDDQQSGKSGREFPRIGRIEGRSHAIIICNNGTWLPGTFFAHYFKEYDHIIRHYQVIQKLRDNIILKIVPGPHFSNAGMAEAVQGLRPFVGDRMGIEVMPVDEIPLGRTGKRTGVISELDLDFQKLADEITNYD